MPRTASLASCFFQKNAEHLAIPGITMLDKQLTGQPMMLIDNAEALVGAVQMSTVELHTWNATSDKLDKPDRFVLDLDPDPALPWKRMVEATQLTLSVLDELGLKAFLKTSGGKGIHVVVPLTRKLGWDEVKDFSHAIVNHMAKLLPERFSAVSGPKNRVGRIFIDYLRNGLGRPPFAPTPYVPAKGCRCRCRSGAKRWPNSRVPINGTCTTCMNVWLKSGMGRGRRCPEPDKRSMPRCAGGWG